MKIKTSFLGTFYLNFITVMKTKLLLSLFSRTSFRRFHVPVCREASPLSSPGSSRTSGRNPPVDSPASRHAERGPTQRDDRLHNINYPSPPRQSV